MSRKCERKTDREKRERDGGRAEWGKEKHFKDFGFVIKYSQYILYFFLLLFNHCLLLKTVDRKERYGLQELLWNLVTYIIPTLGGWGETIIVHYMHLKLFIPYDAQG